MQWILLWAKENKNKEKMKGMTGRYRGHCERKKKKNLLKRRFLLLVIVHERA